jgi:hypothetical protein
MRSQESVRAKFEAGDKVEHKITGKILTVTRSGTCHTDSVIPEKHPYYKVTTPNGGKDEVCSHSVRKA